MAYLVSSPTFTGLATFNGSISLSAGNGMFIGDGAPALTVNTLYNVGGSLYFNGSALAGGSGGGGSNNMDCGGASMSVGSTKERISST